MSSYVHGDLVEVVSFPGVVWEIESFRFGTSGEPTIICLMFWGGDRSTLSTAEERKLWKERLGGRPFEIQRDKVRRPNEMLVLALAAKRRDDS